LKKEANLKTLEFKGEWYWNRRCRNGVHRHGMDFFSQDTGQYWRRYSFWVSIKFGKFFIELL